MLQLEGGTTTHPILYSCVNCEQERIRFQKQEPGDTHTYTKGQKEVDTTRELEPEPPPLENMYIEKK